MHEYTHCDVKKRCNAFKHNRFNWQLSNQMSLWRVNTTLYKWMIYKNASCASWPDNRGHTVAQMNWEWGNRSEETRPWLTLCVSLSTLDNRKIIRTTIPISTYFMNINGCNMCFVKPTDLQQHIIIKISNRTCYIYNFLL